MPTFLGSSRGLGLASSLGDLQSAPNDCCESLSGYLSVSVLRSFVIDPNRDDGAEA
jgi:hypothetical protein